MQKENLYIVKVGGNVINDEKKLKSFLTDFSSIKDRKLLIHGGGKILDELSKKLEIPQEMINGRRKTDADTLKLATMVYGGLLNKNIVAQLQAIGNNAIGLTGADANCIKASKRINKEFDFGFVGDIEPEGVNSNFITTLLENNITPVFCSITHDNAGQLFNTNADTMAATLAIALNKKYNVHLNFCFEKKGVLKNAEDDNSVLSTISTDEYSTLLQQEIIIKGMIPKLDNAFNAAKRGVNSVAITHADELLNTINKKENVGTHLIA
jgi:acetylglutamate kinase